MCRARASTILYCVAPQVRGTNVRIVTRSTYECRLSGRPIPGCRDHACSFFADRAELLRVLAAVRLPVEPIKYGDALTMSQHAYYSYHFTRLIARWKRYRSSCSCCAVLKKARVCSMAWRNGGGCRGWRRADRFARVVSQQFSDLGFQYR
jgi:hypothetical protein